VLYKQGLFVDSSGAIDLSPDEPIKEVGFELMNFKVKHRFKLNYREVLKEKISAEVSLYCLEHYVWHRIVREVRLDDSYSYTIR
jgi:hypothetical protein